MERTFLTASRTHDFQSPERKLGVSVMIMLFIDCRWVTTAAGGSWRCLVFFLLGCVQQGRGGATGLAWREFVVVGGGESAGTRYFRIVAASCSLK